MLERPTAEEPLSPVSGQEFRAACGRFATGITVVTTVGADGAPVGVTVNSFSSVSLDPPLVLFCLDRAALSFPAFEGAKSFAINVLREGQRDLSVRFSQQGAQKFGDLDVQRWETGCPILANCLANLECRTEAIHPGGDHIIMVGRVVHLSVGEEGRPLLYYGGAYRTLEPPR